MQGIQTAYDGRKRESLRKAFRPIKVHMLFVGEAPPASGLFFYSQNSGLYRAMRQVFQAADATINDDNFLQRFQNSGCYLIDACREPVDRLDRKMRRAVCIAAEPALARDIEALRPEKIVTLVRSIRPNVERALLLAGWEGPVLNLPYPGRWVRSRATFQRELLPHLQVLLHNTAANR